VCSFCSLATVLAEAMLDTYLAWQIENRNEIVGVEKRFQIMIAGRTVKGFIDRIEKTPEGGYVVIDFKTGSKPSDLTKNTIPENLQMNVYSLTVQQLFGSVPERASLFYLKDKKMVDYHPTAESMAAFRARIEGLIAQICAEEFEARPSERICRRCDFGEVCGEREGD
jgi:DNA helicase-2/ATP-dependent DNA helicase PcrA